MGVGVDVGVGTLAAMVANGLVLLPAAGGVDVAQPCGHFVRGAAKPTARLWGDSCAVRRKLAGAALGLRFGFLDILATHPLHPFTRFPTPTSKRAGAAKVQVKV
jgi:hypothetical protein